MKPLTKGLMIGVVVGVILTLVVEFGGLIILGLAVNSGIGRSWIADRMLRPPRYPQTINVSQLDRFDYEWTLYTLEGQAVSFAEFRGKTVFLNIWATWCGPCKMEMPNIERLSATMMGTDVVFVVVSEEDADVVRSYAERNSLNLPLYVADELPEEFAGDAVPSTFVIDAGGYLVFQHTGAAMWDDDTTEDFLRRVSR